MPRRCSPTCRELANSHKTVIYKFFLQEISPKKFLMLCHFGAHIAPKWLTGGMTVKQKVPGTTHLSPPIRHLVVKRNEFGQS